MTFNIKVIQEEKRLAKKIKTKLKNIWVKISNALIENQKSFVEDLFYSVLVDLWDITQDVAKSTGIVYDLGINRAFRQIKRLWYGNIIDFDKIRIAKELYISSAIFENSTTWFTQTTISWIRDIIAEWLGTWKSYTYIADRIMWQTKHWLLSVSRAKLIAVNQLGRWYEASNKQPYTQLLSVWIWVEKKRLTVWDHKVTPSHTANQEEWRILLDQLFSWTGDDIPPAQDNPRCRCTLQYSIDGIR